MNREELKNLVPQEVVILANVAHSLMLVLNARLFTLLGMSFCAAAFGWVMWQPDWIRAFAACAFTVLCFWPLARMEANRIAATQGDQP